MIYEAAEWKFFSKIDLKSAYHQNEIRENVEPLTSFEVNGKLYQFCRLQIGITNAGSVFQRCMDSINSDHKLEKTKAYLDDVIVGDNNKEEHDQNLHNIFAVSKDLGRLSAKKSVHLAPSSTECSDRPYS